VARSVDAPPVVVHKEVSRLVDGSWAARRAGNRGDESRDIDVLVIGSAARMELNEASTAAEARLRRRHRRTRRPEHAHGPIATRIGLLTPALPSAGGFDRLIAVARSDG